MMPIVVSLRFLHITEAIVHDMNAMDLLSYEAGAFYVFDRGYLDYTRLHRLHNTGAYFVIRAKSNLKFQRMYSRKADRLNGVICDQIGKLTGYRTARDYLEKIRRVKFHDKESGRTFVFLSNNMEIEAAEITMLYKHRWAIELFFKWIKQHLKIKSFWGTTQNAVRIQILSDMIAPGAIVGGAPQGWATMATRTITPITKHSVIQGFKVSNHAWRKSGLGRGATEELISDVITGAKKAGTVITKTGKGNFSGNIIKVYNHSNVKVVVDETRQLIMSIRPDKGFKLP